MNYEQFSMVKKSYFENPCPKRGDFNRYTNAFFKWADSVFRRCDAKYPGLLVKKLPPLPLFDELEKGVVA